MLNMSSTQPADDRTTRARIRDAAIETYARLGVQATTARKVAAAAGVSPGLVIHHFGSMDGLRAACDEHVAAHIRQMKSEAIGAGLGLDLTAAWRDSDFGHLGAYLARVLVDDSPAVNRLVDDLIDDAVAYMTLGIENGMVRPIEDLRRVTTVVLLWSLGGLVLHEHMQRLLGVDLTAPGVATAPAFPAYAGPAFEILGEGIFTDAFAARVRDTLAGMAGPTEGSA
jgi:AcrR family transcriptional regulator